VGFYLRSRFELYALWRLRVARYNSCYFRREVYDGHVRSVESGKILLRFVQDKVLRTYGGRHNGLLRRKGMHLHA
jgi:hypothetical protein